MKTAKQLQKAYEMGDFRDVYAEIRRYGDIVTDKEWNDEQPGRYAGAWREMWINHKGKGWHFTMHNGEIVEAGYKVAPVVIGIHGQAVTDEENERDKRIRDYK